MLTVLILSGYGLNCEEETFAAFMRASQKLAKPIKSRIVHINEVIANPKQLQSSNILVLPGGFSYGDHTGSGNAFALHMLNNLKDEIQEFLLGDKLVLGICNGCQILVKLIPEFSGISLVHNKTNQYQCRWVRVKSQQKNLSFYLEGIEELYLPVAHGEGRFHMSDELLAELIESGLVALRYLDLQDKGYAKGKFPDNPNDSLWDVAALSDSTGRVLAMMPHPERAICFTQREDWPLIKEKYVRSNLPLPQDGDGLAVFCNAIRYFN